MHFNGNENYPPCHINRGEHFTININCMTANANNLFSNSDCKAQLLSQLKNVCNIDVPPNHGSFLCAGAWNVKMK